jgi:hypothetical protein
MKTITTTGVHRVGGRSTAFCSSRRQRGHLFSRGDSNPYIPVIGVVGTRVGGFPIVHEAYENITQRRMTMEVVDSPRHLSRPLAIREIFTCSHHHAFALVAEIPEGLTVEAAKRFNA